MTEIIRHESLKLISFEGFNITEQAREQAKIALASDDTNPVGIRVGCKGGGCAGFTYVMEFIQEEDIDPEEDIRLDGSEVLFVIDCFSMEYLKGTTLDYSMSLKESGFKFKTSKPGVRQCGCGSSFSG